MFDGKQARRVTVHVGEDHAYRGKSVFFAIVEYLARKRVTTVNVVRGVAGFGADHHMHTTNIERLTENLPVQVEFIASADKVDELLPELCDIVGTGSIEVQDTLLRISAARLHEKLLTPKKRKGKEKLLRIFVS